MCKFQEIKLYHQNRNFYIEISKNKNVDQKCTFVCLIKKNKHFEQNLIF